MSEPPYRRFVDVAAEALGELRGLRIADLGCGAGGLTRALAREGAEMIGVEPNAAQVGRAEAEGGGPRYVVGSAEDSGLDAGAVDVAFFSMSLHHVPDMAAGLREARRITRPGGRLAVLEPIAPDPFYPVMRLVDDESAAYDDAQAALEAAVAAGVLSGRATTRYYASKYRVETVEELLGALVTVDSGRSLPDARRAAFEAAFAEARRVDADGGYIPTWSRFDVFDRA